MNVRISRVDPTIPLPSYKTAGAVAFDLAPRVDATIAPGGVAYIPANVIVEVPCGYVLIVAARSSLHKRGLLIANQLGIVDQDYCGPNDELLLAIRNTTNEPITVQRGERLAQGLFVPVSRAEWEEVNVKDITTETRGGWGSTGT